LIGPSVVTTGLDPVVHADVQQSKHRMLMRLSYMDCRVKPGNDAEMAWPTAYLPACLFAYR
jgi:hypothetical protein